MLLIGGTGSKTTILERGQFFCPTCSQERSYEHKAVKKIATFFFVPVANFGELGRYVECQYCHETFRQEVLNYHPGPNAEEIEAECRKGTPM